MRLGRVESTERPPGGAERARRRPRSATISDADESSPTRRSARTESARSSPRLSSRRPSGRTAAVRSCTTPSASMTAVMPEIAACTTGPAGLGRAHLADREVLGRVRRAPVRAVVRRHDDHLRAVAARAAGPGSRTPTRSRSPCRSRVPATSNSPGPSPGWKSRGTWSSCADPALEQPAGTARTRRTARGGAWRTCRRSRRRDRTARRGSSALSPVGSASTVALASTHAWCCARDRREVVADERVGARVGVHARLGEHDQVDRVGDLPGQVEVAVRQVARVELGVGELAVLVVALDERDAQDAGDRAARRA